MTQLNIKHLLASIRPALLITGAVLLTSCAQTNKRTLDLALQQAGANKAELEKALKQAPENQREGLSFLITHMPERDLTSLKANFLLTNIKLAYQARETYPWAKKVPKKVFFNDVLPYASLNERRDDWRADFMKRFAPYVKDAKTAEEAITAIGKAIKDEVKVKYSTKRKKPDQSPYESMEQGLASCTGLSILLTDAYRAVGIPCRVAGIPAWTTKRGNHNWVEVYTPSNNKWHSTEYYPDSKGLDHGWYMSDAAKANPKSLYHSIYASSWKSTGQHFPLVWNPKIRYVHGVNVTQRYINLAGKDKLAKDACELRLAVTNKAGERRSVQCVVRQGDVEVGKGMSPKVTDDMNKFLTIPVKKRQLYQVFWIDPDTKQTRNRPFKVDTKEAWFQLNLK